MSCHQCIEIENYFDEQILYLQREIKKRDQALEDQEYEIRRLRHIVQWFHDYMNIRVLHPEN